LYKAIFYKAIFYNISSKKIANVSRQDVFCEINKSYIIKYNYRCFDMLLGSLQSVKCNEIPEYIDPIDMSIIKSKTSLRLLSSVVSS